MEPTSSCCNQCAVWRPREDVTFITVEEAFRHAVTCHPERVVKFFSAVMNEPGDARNLEEKVLFNCRDGVERG